MWQTSFVPDEWSDRRDALPQGCVLRDYTIQEVLGHGGFGIVYKACHNELDHVVAIKEYLPSELAVREGTSIRAKSADCETHFADGLRRFREEAKALIDFQQHPSVVDCRDFFRANGTAYLVMEYVEGLPLSELLRQREAAGQPFTESDLLGIAIPLAQGLAHIHSAGVIHRDIKPANILVRQSDHRPVLIDFGAAKQAVAEHSRSLAPYTEGYAAFEQVADGQLGPWTDLYGFGAVLWRMVAGGNRPWDPPNPVKVERRANAGLREVDDPLPAAKELGAGRFADEILETIDGCLQLRDSERIRESDRVVQMLQGSSGESPQPAAAEQHSEGGHDVDLPDPVSDVARTGRSSTGRPWKIVGVAAAIAVAVALAAVSLIPRDENTATPERWGFSVEAEPTTATVALLNGPEEYRAGMLLVPGQYEIEVSAPGFETLRERVTHSESETLHQVDLEPIPDAESEPRPQTSSNEVAEAADSTSEETERVPSRASNASEPVATEPAVTEEQVNADADAGPSSGCSGGDLEDCIEQGDAYRTGDGVPLDYIRAAEFYELACDGGHAEGCRSLRSLGFQYRDGDGVSQDLLRAAELYQYACDGGDARACWLVGYMYKEGNGVPLDQSRARELYERACDGGYAEGCTIFGFMYWDGEGVSQDMVRAAELYEQACDGGDADGCLFLGDMYQKGEGVSEDHARAAEFYKRACDGGEAAGCRSLGFLHRDGEGVPEDQERAAGLFQRACDSGDAVGCRLVGYMHENGEGMSQDRLRAAELFQRACEGGDATGCWTLGYRYEDGKGVPKDHGRAARFYQRACEGGEAAGCWSLGLKYEEGEGVPLDRARAAALYERACDSGDAVGCKRLGYLHRDGEGVPLDQKRAAQLFQRACDSGDAGGCSSLALMYHNGDGVPLNRARAAELYHRACEGGDALGCNNLGLLYSNGHGVGQDQVRAAELYHRACEGGDASGCFNLGNKYHNGEGVRQDQARAAELYERACDGDNMSACVNLGNRYHDGDGVQQDRARAVALYKRACEGDNMGGCFNLGLNYYRGHGVGQDKSVAASLFRKACGNGDQESCEALAEFNWR